MSCSSGKDAFDVAAEVTGAFLIGMAFLAVTLALEKRRQAQLDEEEEARLLLEDLFNQEAGNVLGDSAMSFRFEDTVAGEHIDLNDLALPDFSAA